MGGVSLLHGAVQVARTSFSMTLFALPVEDRLYPGCEIGGLVSLRSSPVLRLFGWRNADADALVGGVRDCGPTPWPLGFVHA
jgi:hypothetical protein